MLKATNVRQRGEKLPCAAQLDLNKVVSDRTVIIRGDSLVQAGLRVL